MTPLIFSSVSPTRDRSPADTLNNPSTPRIGTDSPTKARIVLSGRVSKLLQANFPIRSASSPASVHIVESRTIIVGPASRGKGRG